MVHVRCSLFVVRCSLLVVRGLPTDLPTGLPTGLPTEALAEVGASAKAWGDYSPFRTATGSTREARQAGTKLASPATAESSTATAMNVAGSPGRMLYRRPRIS